ncbi:hypothetical protein BD414DRAFT_284950 [Trametes punicea]|nr:hypothetical protein BD414DRAFT_284950 [Trametes punicea]
MPSRPIEAHLRKDHRHKPTRSHINTRQHGHSHGLPTASGPSVLLSIPSESLTHITSFLDPPDLLALGRACKQLYAHVADDNTWRRAYVFQYLGITPESDLRDDPGDKTLMLRREETTWKKEYIMRYNLRRYVIAFRVQGRKMDDLAVIKYMSPHAALPQCARLAYTRPACLVLLLPRSGFSDASTIRCPCTRRS